MANFSEGCPESLPFIPTDFQNRKVKLRNPANFAKCIYF